MNNDNSRNVICPVCDEMLHTEGRVAKCKNNHSFDYAKEGYLNVLLSNQRHSKNPGDSAEMIQSRHSFLESGVYQVVAEKLGDMITSYSSPKNILDAGCGEGYFIRQLSGNANLKTSCFYGVDISKPAVKCAAKKDKTNMWLIGNAMQKLPIKTNSMDVIVSILAPRHIEEMGRVLKNDGTVIIGIPGEHHLIELRKLLLAEEKSFQSKADKEIEKFESLFEHTKTEDVLYKTVLGNEQLTHLTRMTPMYWKASKSGINNVLEQDKLEMTVHFKLLRFTKKGK